MSRASLLFSAAVLAAAMLIDSTALVRLLLLMGAVILLLAAWRFPRGRDQPGTTSIAGQVVRLSAVALFALCGTLIALYALVRTSCPPTGCV